MPAHTSTGGNVHQDMGELEKALRDIDKAIELNPEDARAYSNRGGLHREIGELERALRGL